MRVLAVEHTAGIELFRGKWEWLHRHAGVELTVLAPATWIENFRTVRTDPRVEGYRILTGRVAWRGYENRGFFYTGLVQAFRESRPEVLHLVEEPFSLFALQAIALKGLLASRARVIFYAADNLHTGFHYTYRPSWVYGLVDRLVQRFSDCGVVCSSGTRDVLVSRGFTGPIRFVPLGLDPLHFRRTDASELRRRLGLSRFVVGYAGRLLSMKGIFVLAEALEGATFDWMLLVVGNGPDRDALLARARERGWEARLRIVETVPHDGMPEHLNLMDVLVLPSLSTRLWREQFGRVLVEAMACEVPVVGSSSGAIPEVVGDAGWITPEGDAASLRAVLADLAGNPILRAERAAAGRARVLRHFTWERAAAQYKAIYDGLLDGSLATESTPAWAQPAPAREGPPQAGSHARGLETPESEG